MDATIQQRQHCGEVFVTNNYLMMVECKFCCEQYTAFDKFLNHIFDHHFDDVDKFYQSEDDSAVRDDENILNSDAGEIDEQLECIGLSTEPDEGFKTNNTSESKLSAEVNRFENTQELYSNVSTEISLCPSKIKNQKESDLPKRNINLLKNLGTDPINSKYRSVFTKYRNSREGEVRKFKCTICGDTFAQIHILRSHEKRHSTSKPFPCTKCSKRFFTRTELDTHTRWHTGERPFVCTYCGSSFITNGALNIHEKRHLDKRNYKCDECGKRFFDGRQLRMHGVVHSKERNYKCEQCESTFTRGKSLRNHMKLHENALRYECNICNMRFNQKPSLIWHEKSKHALLRKGVNGPSKITDSGISTEVANISDTEYECKRYDLGFKDKNSLLNHKSVIHAAANTISTKEALEEAESETLD